MHGRRVGGPAFLRSLLFLYIGNIKKRFQWDYYTVFETILGEFYVKILFRDSHEIVKQLQTALPCEIQEIAKYIFQEWLFCRKSY